MKRRVHMAVILGLAVMLYSVRADARSHIRTYSAKISTQSSSVQGKVDIANGEVTTIRWPDGSEKDVDENGELSHGVAIADIKNFGWVRVEINDPSYKADDEEYVDDNPGGGDAEQ
jgi:hypothetical protein